MIWMWTQVNLMLIWPRHARNLTNALFHEGVLLLLVRNFSRSYDVPSLWWLRQFGARIWDGRGSQSTATEQQLLGATLTNISIQFGCPEKGFMFTWLRLSSCQSWKLLEDHSAQAVLDPKRGNLALLHTCGRNCELGWNTQLDLQLNWWQEQGNDIHWAVWKHVHHQAAGLVLDAEWQRLCPWLPRHRNSCDSGFKPKQAVQVLCQASVFRSHEECQDHCESRNCSHHVPVLPSP